MTSHENYHNIYSCKEDSKDFSEFFNDFQSNPQVYTPKYTHAEKSGVNFYLSDVPNALLELGKLLHKSRESHEKVFGNRYTKSGHEKWREITDNEHLNHIKKHLLLYEIKDTSENHLVNAFARIAFMIENNSTKKEFHNND